MEEEDKGLKYINAIEKAMVNRRKRRTKGVALIWFSLFVAGWIFPIVGWVSWQTFWFVIICILSNNAAVTLDRWSSRGWYADE